MKNNIVIIGFMATGKTRVARYLANLLGKEYVSTDEMIIEKENKTINSIFEEEGEIRFRELEIEVIKAISKMDNIVVDCGGGIVLNWINVVRLQEKGIIILLKASIEQILERSALSPERPLLNVQDAQKEINALLRFRKPFYERAADVCIDTTNLMTDDVVTRILEIVKAKD
jgi:shikimate kinase